MRKKLFLVLAFVVCSALFSARGFQAHADLETLNVNSAVRAVAVAACGGTSTLSDMNTQNNVGYGCYEGDTGGGSWEECKFIFVPSSSTESNTYTIQLRWRGGENNSCGSVNESEFNNYAFWNYDTPAWSADLGDPPFVDGGWSGPRTDTLCSSKSACNPYYRGAPKEVTFRIGGNAGGIFQNQDGLTLDLVQLDVYYDPTAPSVSWTSSGFGTYDIDGTASATLTVSDSGGSGLAASNYCYVRHKTNGSWVADGWVGEDGYVCTSTGGDNQYIQCEAYCIDRVDNQSSTVQTTGLDANGTLVDTVDPSSSSPSVDNPYFSPNNSAGTKDYTDVSMSPTDSASGIECYQMEVTDSTGLTHVRWEAAGSCGGDANYAGWSANPTTWANPASGWDGKNDASAFVSEGTYRIYVKAEDKAGRFSPATGSTDQQYCASETISPAPNYGVSVAGTCASTDTDNGVYRQVDEQDVATTETEVAVSGQNNYGTVNSGTFANTQVQDSVDWDWNEGCGWCGINPSACYLDFNMTYNSDVPEGTITALKLQTRYKTEDDNFELYWWNYDTSSWSDRATGVPALQSAYATFNYTLCSGAGNCNPWVSSGGNIAVDWFDEDNCGVENSDYYKVDYQKVDVDYNQRKLVVDYQFNTAVAKASITSVEIRTDAYSGNEAMNIQKYNYTTTSWVSTGYSTPSTEPVSAQIIPICNGSSCTDYVYDSGANRQVKIRYADPTAKDGTVNRLSIDYQRMFTNYGSSYVEVVVDNTNPATTDDWTDNWSGTSPVNVSFAASDNLSGIEWTKYCTTSGCDPTVGTEGTTVSITCAAGSVCTTPVRYASRDNAGNTESTKSDQVRQDLQNPTTTDNWTDNWTNTSPVNITLTPSDGSGSGVQATYYCVDTTNTCTPSTSGTSVSVTCAAGSTCTQYVRYYSKDNVNNSESVNSKQVRQDRIVPATFGTVTPANTATATHVDGTFDFSVTFTEADSVPPTCQYCNSTDGTCDTEWAAGTISGSAPNYTCTITGATCTDGQSLTLNMRATDAASNVGTATSVTRTCDTNAPTFTITGWDTGCAGTQYTNNESYADSSPSFCYSATDARAGLHATTPYTYVFGTDCSAAPSTTTTSASYGASGLTNATKNCFRVYATDAVNNSSSTSTFTYMYNTASTSWKYPSAAGSYVDAFYGGGTIRTYGAEQRFYGLSSGGVFYVLNAADGSEKWKCELDTSPDDGAITNCGGSDYGSVSAAPLIFSGAVYVGTEDGYVLKITDGGATWTLNSSRDLGACAIQSATMTISVGGATKILVGCGTGMYALNDDATFTNWSNWSTNPVTLTGSVTRSIPAFVSLSGGTDPWVYVATQNGTLTDTNYGRVYKIDVDNGAISTTFDDSADYTGYLILRVYSGNNKQFLHVGGVKNPESSSKFYSLDTTSMPATCGAGCVTFTDGGAATGFEGGAAVSSGGTVAYVGNNNGKLYRLNFNGTAHTKAYEFNAGAAIKYGITFRQTTGRLYFGTVGGLFFNVTDNGASFTENLRYHTGNNIEATPAVNAASGKVVIPGVIGRIFSFAL